MRYLRASFYKNETEHVTTVIAEDSLKTDIHSAANGMVMGNEVDVEIFEHGGDLIAATMEGERRAAKRLPDAERKRIILLNWCIAMLQSLVPLPVDTIWGVLEEVRKHPSYRSQKVVLASEVHPHAVFLENGKLRTERMEA
jgi:hypothetical protein